MTGRQRLRNAVAAPRSSLEKVIDEYLLDRKADELSPKTIGYYGMVLKQNLVEWCLNEGYEMTDLDEAKLRRWAVWLMERRAKPSHRAAPREDALSAETRKSYVRCVNTFLHWARRQGKIDHDARAPMPKVRHEIRDTLTAADYHQLLAAADHRRDQLILQVLWQTGMRASELTGLTTADVLQLGSRSFCLRIQPRKGLDGRQVPIKPELFRDLQRYIQRRSKDTSSDRLWLSARRDRRTRDYEPLTPSGLGQLLKGLAERAGLDNKPVNPHIWRHSFITNALRKHMAVQAIADTVGHKSVAMIAAHYTHFNYGDTEREMLKFLSDED